MLVSALVVCRCSFIFRRFLNQYSYPGYTNNYKASAPVVLSALLFLLSAVPANAADFTAGLSASPNPNTGTYTVSWGSPPACAGMPLVDVTLVESGPEGNLSYTASLNADSKSFTGKTLGSYTYKLEVTCEDWDAIEMWTEFSEAITVTAEGYNAITTPPTQASATIVGTTPYLFDVGTDGDANVVVPLQTIIGVAGFNPSLAIEYDSGRGIDRLEQSLPEDTLGYGWRVSGLSQIRRCIVNQSSGSSIQLSSSDSLCLNTMPLVLASGAHWQVGAVYRTAIERYIKVEIKGSTGALWFEATLPDGTVQQYGNVAGSRVDKSGGTDYQWSITQATSVDGNVVTYKYYHDATNGINYPTNINYTNADVDFEYQTRSDASAVSIGSASQHQSALLHTVKISFRDKLVREYRLFDETSAGKRRLNKIQQCGYDEAGVTISCLKPLDFSWVTPSPTMAGVNFLVSGLTDGLGANHQFHYGTITGSSHSFLFTERPFGNGTLATDTQLLPGSGALRHVATKLRRDNGLGGYHDTSYAYQNRGISSTRHWGFLGFYAQRIKDEQSGIVTYAQYRVDYPYFGQVAKLYQYDNIYGAHTQMLTRTESQFNQHSISHGSNSTVYAYISSTINFIFEGGAQLGATITNDTVTFATGFLSQIDSVVKTGTGVSTGASGSTWGDTANYTLSGIANTTNSTSKFTNRTTGGKWLINFTNEVTAQSWPGVPSGGGILNKTTFSPQANSLKVASSTRFPGDANLELTRAYTWHSVGTINDETVTGANVTERYTWFGFTEHRYLQDLDKRIRMNLNLETHDFHDVRFGKIKQRGYFTGREAYWTYDPLGREVTYRNHEGTTVTTSYTLCTNPLVSCPTINGRQPVYRTESDSPVTPIKRSYHDVLGRVVRTETESFNGTFARQDITYDTQGRVQSRSVPYFSGTVYSTTPTYDIRDRITLTTRPDGSSTSTAYSVSGSTVIVTVTDTIRKADGSSDGTQVKRNEFNILGQLIKTTDAYGTSEATSVTYTYDAHGNMLTATVDGGVAGTTTTTYEYDAAGNRTKVIDPDAGTVNTTYTALGEVKTQTDNKGQTTTFAYDSLGRVTSRTSADGTSTWTWDNHGTGMLAYETNSGGFEQHYYYNTDGKPSSTTTYLTAIGESTAGSYTTSYTYDANGRPSTVTYPSGITVSHHFNSRGYLAQIKNGSTVLQTLNNTDAFGHNTQKTYGNGVVSQRSYDPKTGRLTDIDSNKGSATLQNNQYAWRSNGTLESRLANPDTSNSTTRKEAFGYDALNRVTLTTTTVNASYTRSLNYQYNKLGNITAKTSTQTGDDNVTGYSYGAGSAGAHAVTGATVNGTGYTLSYDANGAIIRYDIAGTSTDKYITYNASNQPTKIVVGTSINDSNADAVDEFRYDPSGKLYARKTTWKEGTTTYTQNVRYIGDVEYITMTQNPYDIISTYKTRISKDIIHVKTQVADNINPPFNPYWVSHTEYAHRDHLGSIEVVTDDSGNVLNDLAFEPFGSRKSAGWEKNITPAQLNALLDHKITSTGKVRGFTGHRHSDRTGFIHMNGRVYDPLLGRFLSPDPIVQSPDFSQSWNRYSYVFNNPLRFVDPTGFVGANDDGNNCIDDPSCTIVYISAENFARLNSETEQTSMTQQLDTFGLWANIVSDGVSGGGYGQRVAFGTDHDVITANYLDWWGSSHNDIEEIAQKNPLSNSSDALLHYFNGNGQSASLSDAVKQRIMNHPNVQDQIVKNINGTGKPPFRIDINFEGGGWDVFHIGDTKVIYNEICSSGSCTTTFTAPIYDSSGVPDRFQDPLDLGFELPGGTPFNYQTFDWSVTYPKP